MSYLRLKSRMDSNTLKDKLTNYTNYVKLTFVVCSVLPFSVEEKQKLLEANEIVLRMKKVISLLEQLIKVLFLKLLIYFIKENERRNSYIY